MIDLNFHYILVLLVGLVFLAIRVASFSLYVQRNKII